MAEGLVSFTDWQKLDLRVGKILSVEDHPDAERLYVVEVDLGSLGKRKIVAGLKKNYTKKALIGKLCIVFTNLEPAVIRGVKSEGMILAASDEKGEDVKILAPSKKIALGSKVH